MPRDDRERFEQENRDYIRLVSRDAACRLEALPAVKKKVILRPMTTLEILLLFFEEIFGHELYEEFQR